MSWTVEVYVRAQADESLKAYFSNHAQGGAAIHELDYKLSRIGGCCELELVASRDRAQGHSVSVGNLIEVYAESDDEARDRKYRGLILSVDEDYVDGTLTIKGWGFWAEFEWAILVKYMETTDVASVVGDIYTAISGQTYCSGSSIGLSSSATIGDIELDFQAASDAIKKLAEIQEAVDYGVDEDGTFFFADKTTTKRGHFQVGLNVAGLKVSETMEDLYNDVLIRTRGAVSNGALILHEDDTTSITSYKKRTKVLDSPEFAGDIANSITWGEARVTEGKSPLKVYKFQPLLSEQKHFPYRGTVALVDSDGTSLITAADIESVEYSFREKEGFSQKLGIGDGRADWDAGRMFAELDRQVKILKTSEISATKIDHSAYEEFIQHVHQDAFTNDLYNVFVGEFEEDAV